MAGAHRNSTVAARWWNRLQVAVFAGGDGTMVAGDVCNELLQLGGGGEGGETEAN
jgi:hypothetical protein